MANRGLFFFNYYYSIYYKKNKYNILYCIEDLFPLFPKKKKNLFPFGGFRSLPKWHKALILSIIEKLIQYSGE